MKQMQIETLILGMIGTNCYLAMNKQTKSMFIVDPADEVSRIIHAIGMMGGKPEAILLTHGHFDHIGAAEALKEEYQIPICALKQEQEILENPSNNLSGMYGRGFVVKPDRLLRDKEELTLAGTKIQVIHTPGHTIGGACYYLPEEEVLFAGDTLFRCSVGRTDFPTGSMSQIHDSIHDRLFILPEETIVYPGHQAATDIRFEKMFNPY